MWGGRSPLARIFKRTLRVRRENSVIWREGALLPVAYDSLQNPYISPSTTLCSRRPPRPPLLDTELHARQRGPRSSQIQSPLEAASNPTALCWQRRAAGRGRRGSYRSILSSQRREARGGEAEVGGGGSSDPGILLCGRGRVVGRSSLLCGFGVVRLEPHSLAMGGRSAS